MTRRIIGIIAAVVFASVGTLVLVLYVQNAEQRALAGERTVDVLVVQAPVRQGTPAAQLEPLVELTTVPAKVQALDSIASLDEVADKVAAVDLVPGEQLVDSRFVTPDELAAQQDVEIPDGLQLITIALDPTRVLGGEMKPGDRVGVVASFAEATTEGGDAPLGAPTDTTTHFLLNRILVANVQGEPQPAEPAADGEGEAEGTPGNNRPGAPGSNLLVTFAVDAPSAERLIFAAEHGTIWLTLQNDTTSDDGARIWTKDSIYQ